MTDKKKTLLNESTVRRFMALAGVQSLVNPFLEKINEVDSPVDLDVAPEPFQPPTAQATEMPETPGTPSVVEEGEELEEAEKLEETEELEEAPTSRTLAESILRHIPNLEIVDDESTFKTTGKSDILQEVLRRVKEKLS